MSFATSPLSSVLLAGKLHRRSGVAVLCVGLISNVSAIGGMPPNMADLGSMMGMPGSIPPVMDSGMQKRTNSRKNRKNKSPAKGPSSPPAKLNLDSLMGQLSGYRETGAIDSQSCEECVAKKKEWCTVWDSCDVEECDEQDVIKSDCTQLLQKDSKYYGRRPKLARGTLVQVMMPGKIDQEALDASENGTGSPEDSFFPIDEWKSEFFLEGEVVEFWEQIKDDVSLLKKYGFHKYAAEVERIQDEIERREEIRSEKEEQERLKEQAQEVSANGEIMEVNLDETKAVAVDYHFKSNTGTRSMGNLSKNETNIMKEANNGMADVNAQMDGLESSLENPYDAWGIPLIGVVGRAYTELDEYTVADDWGLELKFPILMGPKQHERAFEFRDRTQDKLPVYFGASQLRLLSGVRRGDYVRARLENSDDGEKRMLIHSDSPEDQLLDIHIKNCTSSGFVGARIIKTGAEVYIERSRIEEEVLAGPLGNDEL